MPARLVGGSPGLPEFVKVPWVSRPVGDGEPRRASPDAASLGAASSAYAAACLAIAATACGSATAMSARTLRSRTMFDFFRPAMKREYETPFSRAAALIRAIQRERK